MREGLFRKSLVLGIIVLFVGASVVSGINIKFKNTTITDSSGSVNTLNGGNSGSDLVAHWHFDEGSGTTAYDSSGNNYNITICGCW